MQRSWYELSRELELCETDKVSPSEEISVVLPYVNCRISVLTGNASVPFGKE